MHSGSTGTGTPPAEHSIDAALVGVLLADQHPELTGLPLSGVQAGWTMRCSGWASG